MGKQAGGNHHEMTANTPTSCVVFYLIVFKEDVLVWVQNLHPLNKSSKKRHLWSNGLFQEMQ